MATKFNIQGDLIGTTAENVEYTKSGWQEATNAKTALDNLQERLSEVEQNGGGGSASIDSAADVPYTKQGWSNVTNVKQALDDVESRLAQAESDIDELDGGGAENGPVIYAYGDSIVTDNLNISVGSGYMKSILPSPCNCARIVARLSNAQKLYNRAQSGAVVGGMLQHIYNVNDAPVNSDADFVILMVGVNNVNAYGDGTNTSYPVGDAQEILDAEQSAGVTNPMNNGNWPSGDLLNNTYLGQILRIIRCALYRAPNCKVVVCAPIWCGAIDMGYIGSTFQTNRKTTLNGMRAGLKELVDLLDDEHVVFVNTFNCGIGSDNYSVYFNGSDTTHPNRAGSKLVGEYIYKHGILGIPETLYGDNPTLDVRNSGMTVDGSNGVLSFSTAAGTPITKTLKLNGTDCGDVTLNKWGAWSSYFSFSKTTIKSDSIRNIVEGSVDVTFSPPASLTGTGNAWVQFLMEGADGEKFGTLGFYLRGIIE